LNHEIDLSQVSNPKLRKKLASLANVIADNPKRSLTETPKLIPVPAVGFVASSHDIPLKDGTSIMDIAVFRLSKSQGQSAEQITYELNDAHIEVKAGPDGMATIYDYDLVLLMISHLNEAIKLHRKGKGAKPGNRLCISAAAIFRYSGRKAGGASYKALEASLDRLQGTTIKITAKRGCKRRTGYFPLLAGAEVLSNTLSGKVSELELIIPDWIYESVLKNPKPEVLTVSKDYFKLTQGLARFVYRLARKAAGTGNAEYYFKTIYERSGSSREFKKFVYDLKALVRKNHLPDYSLSFVEGKFGPKLLIAQR